MLFIFILHHVFFFAFWSVWDGGAFQFYSLSFSGYFKCIVHLTCSAWFYNLLSSHFRATEKCIFQSSNLEYFCCTSLHTDCTSTLDTNSNILLFYHYMFIYVCANQLQHTFAPDMCTHIHVTFIAWTCWTCCLPQLTRGTSQSHFSLVSHLNDFNIRCSYHLLIYSLAGEVNDKA